MLSRRDSSCLEVLLLPRCSLISPSSHDGYSCRVWSVHFAVPLVSLSDVGRSRILIGAASRRIQGGGVYFIDESTYIHPNTTNIPPPFIARYVLENTPPDSLSSSSPSCARQIPRISANREKTKKGKVCFGSRRSIEEGEGEAGYPTESEKIKAGCKARAAE